MSDKKCRDCKHYRPCGELIGRCLHPRLGGHPAVLGGLIVSADDLMCAEAGLYLWERRPKEVQFTRPELFHLEVSGNPTER